MPTILDGERWIAVTATELAQLRAAHLVDYLRERDPDEDAEGPIYTPAEGKTMDDGTAVLRPPAKV